MLSEGVLKGVKKEGLWVYWDKDGHKELEETYNLGDLISVKEGFEDSSSSEWILNAFFDNNMIKYIKLSALNISVVSLVGSVIWLVMDYNEGNEINLYLVGFILFIIIILSLLFKDVWNTYDELNRLENPKDLRNK